MPTFQVDFDVWCSCGNGLCNQSSVKDYKGLSITVEPCDRCLDRARDEGYQEGFDDGEANVEVNE